MEKEKEFVEFIDMVNARYSIKAMVYDKLHDFVLYLNYTEALKEADDAFKSLLEAKYLNAIVEGGEMSFSSAYKKLKEGTDLNFKQNKNYSGVSILNDGIINRNFDRHLREWQNKDYIKNKKHTPYEGGRPMASCMSSSSSCGSSYSRC